MSAWGAAFGVAWGDAFGGSGSTPAAPAVPGYSGGFLDAPARKNRKQERIQAIERHLRGEVPQRVARTIARVAEQQISEPVDDLDERLERALERQNVKLRALYAELLHQQIQRIQRERQDDEDIALLLLLH